eukprot:4558504-Alexandrium_andersonii.AAC.1
MRGGRPVMDGMLKRLGHQVAPFLPGRTREESMFVDVRPRWAASERRLLCKGPRCEDCLQENPARANARDTENHGPLRGA